MSAADDAYAAAERLIAEAKADGRWELSFSDTDFHALDRLPPEIRQLTDLRHLYLSNTYVCDLRPLSGLTLITDLSLDNTPVNDLAPLSELPWMTSLSLNNTQVHDLGPLSGLTGVTHLNFGKTQVSDLGPLSKLTAITHLDFYSTPVSELTPLAKLKSIVALSFENTEVSDIGPLSGLTDIAGLDLRNTQVSDLRPILGMQKLVDSSALLGLHFDGCSATRIDPRIAEIAEIEDNAERARVLFEYLADWEPPGPPEFPAQSEGGLRYRIGSGGVAEYDPNSSLPTATRQQSELHAILREDGAALAQKCGSGHNQPYAVYGAKLGRYLAGLADSVVAMQPVLVWKAGNDLRILLRDDGKRAPSDMSILPQLDSDLRAEFEGFLAAHNALSALHPDLSQLDLAKIDPAMRQFMEQNQVLVAALLDGFAAQTRLIMTEVVEDLRDLLQGNAVATNAALRDLAVGQESLENLIKAILAQAVIETHNESFLSKIAGDVRSAAVGTVVVGSAQALAPGDPAAFAQLVSNLQPQLAALLSGWHGTDCPVAKAVDWVKLRITGK